MQVQMPGPQVPVRLVFETGRGVSKDAYLAFCRANPDLRCERTAEGEIVIVPPAGGESANRSMKVSAQLYNWAERDGRGEAFDASAEFLLPDGSALSPDAAWVSNKSLRRLTWEQRREFPPVCPEFIVEVMSPSDNLRRAKAKMEVWISNGVRLGWLIDADHQTVYVYRRGRPARALRGIQELAGEGPAEGFVLRLGRIWQGLR